MSSFYHVVNVILDVIIVYAFVSNFNYFVLMALGFFVLRTQRTTEGSVETDAGDFHYCSRSQRGA